LNVRLNVALVEARRIRMMKLPNIVPVTDLRSDAARVLEQVKRASKPTVVTQRGRAAAVLMSLSSYEQTQEELALLRALLRGEQDIAHGGLVAADDVFAEAEALLAEPDPER